MIAWIRNHLIAELADRWMLRQRRIARRQPDKAEYLSAPSFAYWMHVVAMDEARRGRT